VSLRDLLTDHRDDIVARFVSAVQQKDLAPPGLAPPLLVDHIPQFLDEILEELNDGGQVRFSRDAIDESSTARRHGGQRWSLGYDLEGVVREYGILRHAILEAAKITGSTLTIDEFDILAKCLNVGVAEAATEFARYHNVRLATQKADLEFLLEAGQLLTSSLDYRSTLTRLTRLIVPKLADWCAIHIEGVPADSMPIAHVSADKVAVLREIFARFPLPTSAPYGYAELLRSGDSQLVEDVPADFLERSAQSPEHLALLQSIASRSFIVVPLRVQSTVFGAITLACSESERHFDAEDLKLAEELARRAAVAIDNARLYELSQEERARVEAATRAKDEFVAMVSHELRTPLNAILGWMRLVRAGHLPAGKLEQAYGVIERNANAQNQLVGDLLDISRVITGAIRINPSQVDFSNIVDMAVEDARMSIEAKRITLTVDMDRENSIVRGDSDRLQQVVWNLLTNAVKFTAKDGSIRITVRRVESDIELAIVDNGVGITPDFLPHVFETFRQSDSTVTRTYSGLGIGLSITKHLVELHGGSIQAISDGPGHGASFVVRIPVSPLVSTTVGVGRPPAATAAGDIGAFADTLAGLRILVVDDDDDARELLLILLETCQVEARGAGSARDAIAALAEFQADVIISDIGMPGEDGYSLIRSIRASADKRIAATPAIALTAYARPEDRTKALVHGFNMHLTKPVAPTELLALVADLSGRQRQPLREPH
jgi:signal transduction histidine kinase/ActR/RegA family two-component response regulator